MLFQCFIASMISDELSTVKLSLPLLLICNVLFSCCFQHKKKKNVLSSLIIMSLGILILSWLGLTEFLEFVNKLFHQIVGDFNPYFFAFWGISNSFSGTIIRPLILHYRSLRFCPFFPSIYFFLFSFNWVFCLFYLHIYLLFLYLAWRIHSHGYIP